MTTYADLHRDDIRTKAFICSEELSPTHTFAGVFTLDPSPILHADELVVRTLIAAGGMVVVSCFMGGTVSQTVYVHCPSCYRTPATPAFEINSRKHLSRTWAGGHTKAGNASTERKQTASD